LNAHSAGKLTRLLMPNRKIMSTITRIFALDCPTVATEELDF